MSELKHTPGPWEIVPIMNASGMTYEIGSQRMRDAEADITVYDFHLTPKHLPTGECLANVFLIAAAPDLLDALKQCAAVCAGETTNKNGLIAALEAARDAIAKATGSKP